MNHIKSPVEVGIIGAMKIEVDALCDMMQDATVETIAGIAFHRGTLCGRSVVVAQCGIGKVFAAMCVQVMILSYAPAVIVNTGVAGTLTDKLSIGQVAIADRLVQHDMDTTPLGDPAGLISGINMVYFPADPKARACLAECVAAEGVTYATGTVASGDQFIGRQSQKDFIKNTFENVVACEMEGASIAHVCYMNATPCAVLRAISDGGDDDAAMDYPTFCAHAAQVAIRVMVRFLETWEK